MTRLARTRRQLSALVICCNEADRIQPCLDSLAGWVDEIIVFDSGSTDGTLDIVRRYTDKVWVTDWPGYGPQRNRALAQCSGEWVLYVDADERVTPELRDEIDRVLAEDPLDCTLLKLPWQTWFCGRPLRHGRYASPQARLFRRSGARFRNDQVHESLLLPRKKTRVLKAPLEHHSWRNYSHCGEKHVHYACLLAQQKREQGRHGSLPYAVLRFFTDFLQQYLLRLSLLDGWRGLLISITLAQYAFHKYAALWALEQEQERRPRPHRVAPVLNLPAGRRINVR